MASPPCYPPTSASASALYLGLSDSEDEDDGSAALDDSGGCSGDVGAEGLSTTPSSSSESGSSSLEARRSAPRPRVAKRSLRGELLERWPGWTSPARKRLRSASPDPPSTATPFDWAVTASSPGTPLLTGPGVLSREYERFWKLVEKIASQSSLVLAAGSADDCERLCCGHVDLPVDQAPAADSTWPATPPGRSPRAPRRPRSRISAEEETPPSARGHRGAALRRDADATIKSVILAVPDDALDDVLLDDAQGDDFHFIPPPPAFSSVSVDDEDVPGAATPPPPGDPPDAATDAELPADQSQRQPRAELLEHLQLLAGRPLPAAAGAVDQDKADVEEDSSVLQLLVLTPTEERKLGPAPPGSLGPGRPRGGVAADAAAKASRCRNAVRCLHRLRVPYLFILLGVAQVTLYAAPTPYGAQEMKNMFVWDSSRLFTQPWRTLSYAMLHSGQMHIALNVGVQTIVGTPLEREQGALRVAAVYFGGALYGAIVTGVVSPSLLMVGASAGIYSILMSHLAQIMLNPATVRYGKPRAAAVLLLTSADMAYTAHHALQRGNAAPRIGVTAHCAGAVSGLFLGLAFYRTVPAAAAATAAAPPTYFCYCCHTRCVLRALQVASSTLLAATAVFCLVWIRVLGTRYVGAGL